MSTDQLVTAQEIDQMPLILVQPGNFPPREGRYFNRICTYKDVQFVLDSASKSQYVAVDFETKGADYSSSGFQIMGIGLSWDKGSCYLPYPEFFNSTREEIHSFLRTHTGLIAHNVYFDGGVVRSLMGFHVNWKACTYALLAQTANEGYPGQRWGLKDSMVDILGWENANEYDRDKWLVTNGYYKGNLLNDNSYDNLFRKFQEDELKPDLNEMWRVPKDILGKYCILDCEGCYLLYTEVLVPLLEEFHDLRNYHESEWLGLVEILIDQKIHGIEVDRQGLLDRNKFLEFSILELRTKFEDHEQTKEHISDIEAGMREAIVAKEPAKLKKDGEVSKNWINWQERLQAAERGENPDYRFNIQSPAQLIELMYDRLGNEVRVRSEKGQPGVGIKSLKHMGELGLLLVDRVYYSKELSYINKYLDLTEARNTIHPSFRSPGTMTGRLSSKEPNIQQIPKSQAVMSLFRARAGHVWVDLDFSALESVVATEYSQDPNLLALYSDDAPENDIHLFVAAHVPGEMSRKVLATGYTPINPPRGTVKLAKKEAKAERSIAKTVVYACQYGAGVDKVMETLENDDIFLPYDQVRTIHTTYWDTFSRLKDFSKSLWYEWKKNKTTGGGYILNGVGRPMAVPERLSKDLLSRFIQSTGHDLLTIYIRLLVTELSQAEIPWKPIIIDLHDATTIEVPEEFGQKTVDIFNLAMVRLNELLQGSIKLRGIPTIGKTLADIKEPEE